ncbi:MAG: TetR family transcriptional regulator [Rectinemataceae bacterium]
MDITELFDRPADPARATPEERILVAALDCIAESGLEATTVRSIAAKAGLNAAAVNYYYRSKEKLVEAALRSAWVHVSEDIERIMRAAENPGEALEAATRFLLEGAFRYPNIIRAILVEQSPLAAEAVAFFKSLFARSENSSRIPSDRGIGTALLLSFALFMGIAPAAVSALTGIDLNDERARDKLGALVTPRLFSL